MTGSGYPQLGFDVHPSVRRAVADAYRKLNDLQVRLNDLENMTSSIVPVPSVAQIQRSLSASGTNPLNIQGLLGVAAQAQIAGIPTVTALPSANDPITQNTGVVRYGGTIYVYDASTEPGEWKPLAAIDYVICDTYANRPAVTTGDNGKLFFATDFQVMWVVVAGAWVYVAGIYVGLLSAMPTLAAGDVGFLFWATNTTDLYMWFGTSWSIILSDRIEQLVRSESAARGSPVTGHPTMRDGELMFEKNTDDSSKMYLWHRKGSAYHYFVQSGSV
jgi:hypothetical protein